MTRFRDALEYIGKGRIDIYKMHSDIRGSHVTPKKKMQKAIIEALEIADKVTSNPYAPVEEPFKVSGIKEAIERERIRQEFKQKPVDNIRQ